MRNPSESVKSQNNTSRGGNTVVIQRRGDIRKGSPEYILGMGKN
jgi:hypothetical protein